MASIKSYTDIEQSRKLSKILRSESADMHWKLGVIDTIVIDDNGDFRKYRSIPAWSLAALLGVLPFHLIVDNKRYAFSMIKGLDKNGETYAIKYAIFNTTFYFYLTDFYDNPVDACVAMIDKLHELKML